MNKKSYTYLLKLNEESENIFENFKLQLGWNKKETILKLLYVFKDLVSELEKEKKLVVQVQDEISGNIIREKVSSFDMLRNPK